MAASTSPDLIEYSPGAGFDRARTRAQRAKTAVRQRPSYRPIILRYFVLDGRRPCGLARALGWPTAGSPCSSSAHDECWTAISPSRLKAVISQKRSQSLDVSPAGLTDASLSIPLWDVPPPCLSLPPQRGQPGSRAYMRAPYPIRTHRDRSSHGRGVEVDLRRRPRHGGRSCRTTSARTTFP